MFYLLEDLVLNFDWRKSVCNDQCMLLLLLVDLVELLILVIIIILKREGGGGALDTSNVVKVKLA